MDIIAEFKKILKSGTMLNKLILINGIVFAISLLIYLTAFLINSETMVNTYANLLAVPASLSQLLMRPWTLVTYMFLHLDFWHILFNMLVLFWFGQIFLYYFDAKKLFGVYFLGGLSGAILYIAAFNLFPVFQPLLPRSIALGASASIMAIVFGISFYKPDFKMNLLFIGPVKILYIALFYIILDIAMIPKENPGGHIAHIGGALWGYLFALRMAKGKDLTRGFNRFMDNLVAAFKPKPKMKVSYKNNVKPPSNDMDYNKTKADYQKRIDNILDKIKYSGYESLTKEEKELLFDAKNKNDYK